MPPKSESLPQPNWKCINIPAQEGHAAAETIPNTMFFYIHIEKIVQKATEPEDRPHFFHLADMEFEVSQNFSANKLIHHHGQSFKRDV